MFVPECFLWSSKWNKTKVFVCRSSHWLEKQKQHCVKNLFLLLVLRKSSLECHIFTYRYKTMTAFMMKIYPPSHSACVAASRYDTEAESEMTCGGWWNKSIVSLPAAAIHKPRGGSALTTTQLIPTGENTTQMNFILQLSFSCSVTMQHKGSLQSQNCFHSLCIMNLTWLIGAGTSPERFIIRD